MADRVDNNLNAQEQDKPKETSNLEIVSVAVENEKEAGISQKSNEQEPPFAELKNDNKLDELSSLEQEIAKMHNIQTESNQVDLPEQLNQATDVENGKDKQQQNDEQSLTKSCTSVNEKLESAMPATEAPLEEMDLIALLKGNDQEQEQSNSDQKNNIELALAQLDNVGVTIEGEGQYEIMEIDDGDNISGSSPVSQSITTKRSKTTPALRIGAKCSTPTATVGKTKLSPEQARAVALEQMADLKAQKARRAVKQQQQQTQQSSLPSSPPNIISSLNDDWNEYDSSSDNASNSNALVSPTPQKKTLVKKAKSALESPQVKVLNKPAVAGQKAANKHKAESELPISNTETTGFKRTRVIKRKIIWDPDVPETQKSFAQYASSKSAITTTNASTSATPSTTMPIMSAVTAKANNLETLATKKARPATPKETSQKMNTAPKRTATPSKNLETRAISSPKRRVQTPSVPNGTGSQVKKKKVSEIDRLMGDEGAANMMQAVEREQRELSGGSDTAVNKPLMRKRAITITGRPAKVVDATPVSPKKETSIKGNKRATLAAIPQQNTKVEADVVFSKAANKSQPTTDTWDYVYKQRASEESMIMRRRSNSSYSSNASVNRLSLDAKPAGIASLSDDATEVPENDPSFKFLMPERKANQRSDGNAQQTLTNDLKRGAPIVKLPKSKALKADLITQHKLDKLMHLIIHPESTKIGHIYTIQLLQKLTEILNKLGKSNDCNTVLLTVQGQQFCQGIDWPELIEDSLEKRRNYANQLTLTVKTYLRSLVTFHKPIVAGVVGNLKNLGLMQLPLFDYVVAADDCTFESYYAQLGQVPEGFAIWNKHSKVSSHVHMRLFLLGEELQTSDVITWPNSFIDKVCKARNVNDEALEIAKQISQSTADHYRTLKKVNQTANTSSLHRLEAEFKAITEQWSTSNFQANSKHYFNNLAN